MIKEDQMSLESRKPEYGDEVYTTRVSLASKARKPIQSNPIDQKFLTIGIEISAIDHMIWKSNPIDNRRK